jgi:small conductance mechanosensitive channel
MLLTLCTPAAVLSADVPQTTGDPDIAEDELQLRLKPLLRAELKTEADAWLQLLEDKVREISTAEIAVKYKQHEIASAENIETALDALEEANSKAAEAPDSEAAQQLVEEAGQALAAAQADAKAAAGIMESDEESNRVIAIAAQKAEERSAAEGVEAAADEPETAAGTGDEAIQTGTAAIREKLDEAVVSRNAERTNLLAYLTGLRGQQTALIDRTNLTIDAFELKGGAVEEVEEYRQYVAAVAGLEVDVTDVSATWITISGWLLSEEGGLRWLKNISLFVVILLIAMFLARLVGKAIEKVMARSRQTSQLLGDFLVTTSRRLVLAIGIIIGLAALEINIGPLLAVIGAAGFVIAFALQDSLGNFASGILIMVFKPFDVGDLVEIGGVLGQVKSMNLLSVLIHTPDNKAVIIPNNNIYSDTITNVTGTDSRRVDLEFGIGYEDDIETAQKIMEQVVSEHPLVLKDPAPVIRVHALADSSVNFVCRPWVRTDDYWEVYWDLTRTVKERFDAGGVSIPFPQRDIHVINLPNNSIAASGVKASKSQSSTDGAVGGDVDLGGDDV